MEQARGKYLQRFWMFIAWNLSIAKAKLEGGGGGWSIDTSAGLL
jgi:hypothetical protein